MPTGLNSPLHPSEADSGAPALGGTQVDVDVEQSPLERLISKSSAEQAGLSNGLSPLVEESLAYAPEPYAPTRQLSIPQKVGSSLATLVAATLCLLQTGLIWASFLSDSWFDTHLLIAVDWQKKYFPAFGDAVDQVLSSTTLASLLSTFFSAEQHWASIIIIISALVFPCLAMIVGPAWTLGDHQERHRLQPATTCDFPRIAFESLLRISLLPYLVLMVLDMGTSSIVIKNRNSMFSILNRSRNGLVCYVLGISCALTVVMVLRLAQIKEHPRRQSAHLAASTSSNNYTRSNPRVPPQQAFQLPWRTARNRSQSDDPYHTPLLSDDVEQTTDVGNVDSPDHGLTFCRKIFLFEVATAAVVLWLPALFLPLFRVEYDGLVSKFMDDTKRSIQFYELPFTLWQRGVEADTQKLTLIALGTVLVLFVYILPMLATILGVLAWQTNRSTRNLCRKLLGIISPCLCGSILALAVAVAVPALQPVFEFFLDEESSGFCKKFEIFTDSTCLSVVGAVDIGIWFLISQAVALEIFVIITLRWLS